MSILQAIILGIVEGLTEFLPISSTGHMIIASALLGLPETDFVKTFIVSIQLGAILSVVVLYWKRFFKSVDFYIKLAVAFIPAGVIGFLLSKKIDEMLGSVEVVAISLFVGGIFLLFVDKIFAATENAPDKEISYWAAFKIGCLQVLSIIPGVSRSGATIVGGLIQKLNRKQAAEFSFFLAVPTMFAATAFKLLKSYHSITGENISLLLIGNIVAFIVAMIAIKVFITYLQKNGFFIFGVYRIIVGAILLFLLWRGVSLNIVG